MRKQELLHYLHLLDVRVDEHQSNDTKVVGFCPFAKWKHKTGGDRRPSFAAFANEEQTSGFICLACREKGTIKKLAYKLGELRGKDYSELFGDITLSEEFALSHFPDYEEMLKAKAEDHRPEPLEEALYHGIYTGVANSPDAVGYLKQRRIGKATAEKLGLLYDDEESRILFPVRGGEGDLYGYTGRSLVPDHMLKVKDYYGLPKRWLILGEELWSCNHHKEGDKQCNKVNRPIIIVEGLFAYAHLHQIGIDEHADIGALLGAVLTPEKRDILLEYNRPIYLLLDNDEGGELGIFGSGEDGDFGAAGMLLGHVPLFVPDWPEGRADPDELTKEEVLYMLENTDPFAPQNLVKIDD